jgi:hypothetical protein
MRALHRLFGLSSAFALAAALTGCGTDIAKTVSCSTAADCIKAGGTLFAPDGSPDFMPQCCADLCVVPSVGCESGFRYLNGVPTVGDCVVAPMCPVQPDLSAPEDMLSPAGDM